MLGDWLSSAMVFSDDRLAILLSVTSFPSILLSFTLRSPHGPLRYDFTILRLCFCSRTFPSPIACTYTLRFTSQRPSYESDPHLHTSELNLRAIIISSLLRHCVSRIWTSTASPSSPSSGDLRYTKFVESLTCDLGPRLSRSPLALTTRSTSYHRCDHRYLRSLDSTQFAVEFEYSL